MNAPRTHIFKNPAGTYSLAGAVPAHPRCAQFMCMDDPKARNAILGGRIVEREGKMYAWNSRTFTTREAAERAVRLAGGEV